MPNHALPALLRQANHEPADQHGPEQQGHRRTSTGDADPEGVDVSDLALNPHHVTAQVRVHGVAV
jgi:hypothetical protein